MNYSANGQPETVINVKEILWDLLSQWKAVFIVALIFALFVPGAKLVKDNGAYKNAITDQRAAEKEASKPASERIEIILSGLSEDDRKSVTFLMTQKDNLEQQEEYLNESIVMNMDPTSLRTLSIKYLIRNDSEVDVQTIVDAYSTCVQRKSVAEKLREVISPDAKIEYIYELYSSYAGNLSSSNARSAIFTVNFLLSNDLDSSEVIKIVDETMDSAHDEITVLAGQHSITRINVEDNNKYSRDFVDRRNNVISSINTMRNSIKNAESVMTEEQKTVYEAVKSIKEADNTASAEEGTSATGDSEHIQPSFSKKYAVLGCILGIFLYVLIYLMYVIIKGKVSSAEDAENSTQSRLIGDVYYADKTSGIKRIFHSKLVDKQRYKKKLDAGKQFSKMKACFEAVCRHAGADKVDIFSLATDVNIVSEIEKILGEDGIKVSRLDIEAEPDERKFTDVKDCVFLVDNNNTYKDLMSLNALCEDYDIHKLGTIFIKHI